MQNTIIDPVGYSNQSLKASRHERYRPSGERWSRCGEVTHPRRNRHPIRHPSGFSHRESDGLASVPDWQLLDEDHRPVVQLIDDDEFGRQTLSHILELAGYEVLQAANGLVGLQQLREDFRPGLILLDLIMPRLNGWDFVCRKQRDPELATIPVILVSATDAPNDDLDPEYANVIAEFRKPYLVSDLLAIIHQCLHPG